MNFVTNDLVTVNVVEFQNLTDRVIAPKSLPMWHKYLRIIFKNTNASFDISEQLVLTSWEDIYFMQHAVAYILDAPNQELELYVWWALVEEFILHTTSDFRQLHSDYANTIVQLEGSTPRSLYCTSVCNQLMGMAVSYAIAEPHFMRTTKPRVISMIENIRIAFHGLVSEVKWMDDQTKCSTHEKLNAMKNFVGFPEWILKAGELDKYYETLAFNKSTHLRNLIVVLQWQMGEKLKTLHAAEDIGWATTPTNVNAFHSFQANAISMRTFGISFLLSFRSLSFYFLSHHSCTIGHLTVSILQFGLGVSSFSSISDQIEHTHT